MPNHRVATDWMGEQVMTLEDLLRPDLRAVCVGINPSRISVEVGHYYQGRLGRKFFKRLKQAGVVPMDVDGYDDDAAFAEGIGFTDLVKRPTARAKEVSALEFQYGRAVLQAKLERYKPKLTIFTYKKTAQVLFGQFPGYGFVPGLQVADRPVFVMPGPYEKADSVSKSLEELHGVFAGG